MGFELIGRRLTPEQYAWVLEHEDEASELLYEWDADSNPVLDDPTMLDLDKVWACLNFLLVGSNARETVGVGAALWGGRALDCEAQWNGWVRLMEVDEVRTVSRHLEAISVEQMRARYAPEVLREQPGYLSPWTEIYVDWALHKFEHLVAFYRDAVREKQAVLLALM